MIDPEKAELLVKTVIWRTISMAFGIAVTYIFTGDLTKSSILVMISGVSLTIMQWGFEIIWDKRIRERLRNVISRQQG